MNTNKTLTRVVLITAAVTVAALGIALLIGLATSGFSWGTFGRVGAPVDERQSVSLDGAESLVIEAASDDIVLADGTGATLDAWLHGSASGATANPPRLVAERNGSTVTMRVERPRVVILGFTWSNVRLDISVPKGYAGDLSVKSTSGTIELGDHRYGSLTLSTTSGDEKVGTVTAASFKAHSTSGTLRAEAVSAKNVDLSSTSGDVRVNALAGDTTLNTTSGSVNVAFSTVPSRIDAGSTSGNVTLRFPADAQFILDARSTSGGIKCDFPITIAQGEGAGRRSLNGAVGTGTAKVTVRTTSGSIRIQK
jgi:lia operon protein LiaG